MDWKLEVVLVPVSDVDRSKRFYAEQLGFNLDLDHQASEAMRIVQLTPRGSGCSVTIGTGLGSMAPGSLQGLQLVVPDIEAALRQLTDNGIENGGIVHFDGGDQRPGPGGDWNSFIFFSDPDGNGWAIQQRPAGS